MTTGYKNKHYKILKGVEKMNIQNFIEELSSIEYVLQNKIVEADAILVPQEANFQLPNTFLKTKIGNKVQSLFKDSPAAPDRDNNIDDAIEFLNEIEIQDIQEINENECFNMQILEKLVRARFGTL